ncbi:MAG: cyanophycinase [bacterium]|nr:cyanophycinase [bacterium]
MSPRTKRKLLIIGGAEDHSDDCVILRRFVELAGDGDARILVVAAAAQRQADAGDRYRRLFRDLGAGRVSVVAIPCRGAAEDPSAAREAGAATGVFFTGGDQLRLTTLLGGTRLFAALQAAHQSGMVVAGTSAGAAAMSDTMIVEGDSDDAPKKCTVKMAPGMGFLAKVVVDQHFAQRGRIGRLLSAIAQNPSVLGLGLDEDTAVEIEPDQPLWVVGSRTATVVDGQTIAHTNTSQSKPEEALAITGVTLHVLPSGYGYHLDKREVALPDGRMP